MIRRMLIISLRLAIIFTPLFTISTANCQDKKVDDEMQKNINAAVDKGAKWLIDNYAQKNPARPGFDSLTLLTLLHADISSEDPAIKAIVDRILKAKPVDTYDIALQAMAFEKLDKITYQGRIADCGQLLIDSQGKEGRWGYTCNSSYLYTTKTSTPANAFKKKLDKDKPDKKVKPIKLARTKMPSTGFDNSNTQYAVLGLRACMDADVIIPKDVFQLAKMWAEGRQITSGGWNYGDALNEKADKGMQQVRQMGGGFVFPTDAYGSMTAGMLGSLAICDYYLKIDNKKDKVLSKGIDWLSNNFKTNENPNFRAEFLYYYLYALERAGMLLDTDKFGNNYWYYEGAKFLLDKQKSDGSWENDSSARSSNFVGRQADTCFAILFLKKATNTLTKHEEPTKKKEEGVETGRSGAESGAEKDAKK